jgi:hypothetical protein
MVAAISNRIDFFFISKQNIFAKIRISERNTKDMGVKEVKEVKKLCELRELTIRIFPDFGDASPVKSNTHVITIGRVNKNKLHPMHPMHPKYVFSQRV